MLEYSLKQEFKRRIIDTIIKGTLREQKSLVTLPELIENGVAFVENISVKRKPYKKLSSIYIITPNKENLNFIEQDFGSQSLYKKLNIYFTSKISNDLINYFKKLNSVKKTSTFKEINLNFKIQSQFIFQPLQSDIDSEIDSIISVVSTLQNVKGISLFWLKNQLFSKSNQISDSLQQQLYQISSLIQPKGMDSGRNLNIFIFDREFDLVTPLIHDFSYENLILDFLNLDLKKLSFKGKQYEVNYDDQVYKKFAYKFIQDAKNGIINDYQLLQETNETAKYKKKQANNVQLDKLRDVFGDLAQYNELIKQYGCHISLSSLVLENIDKQNLKQMTDLEYTLVSGIGENGEKITKEEKIDLINKMIFSYQSSNTISNSLRLALIAKGSIVQDTKIEKKLSSQEQQVYQKFEKLVQKYGNFWPEENKNELRKIVKQKFDDNPTSLHRYYSKMEYYISQILLEGNDNNFNKMQIGEKNKLNKPKGKSYFPGQIYKQELNKNEEKNLLMVYINGGISRTEVSFLKNFYNKQTGERYEVIIGSSEITTPKEYIETFITKNQ